MKYLSLLMVFLLLLLILKFVYPHGLENMTGKISASQATDSSISEEEIKENLKQRLEKVVRDDSQTVKIKKAWVGNLESIANNTLTIATKEGPKLASISAETSYLVLPKRAAIKVEDLEIDSHTIAIGYLTGNHVLNALRVISSEEPPEPLDREANFIIIDAYDPDSQILNVHTLDNQSLELEFDKNTIITTTIKGESQEATSDDLLPQTKAVVIIKIVKEKNLLLHIHLIPTQPEIAPVSENGLDATGSNSQSSEITD